MVTAYRERRGGLVNEDALRVVQAYLRSRDTNLFAREAEFWFMSQGEPLRGRQAIDVILGMLCREVFADVRFEPANVVATESCIVAEFVFRARNIGPLMGALPTGKEVAVPMIAVCEVTGPYITRARLYYDTRQMGTQLGLGLEPW
jgi:predicted ester cyclase